MLGPLKKGILSLISAQEDLIYKVLLTAISQLLNLEKRETIKRFVKHLQMSWRKLLRGNTK